MIREDAAALRREARLCRFLARSEQDRNVSLELTRMAGEYDCQAQAIEGEHVPLLMCRT